MAVQRIGNLPPAEKMPEIRLRAAQQRIAAAVVKESSDIKSTDAAIDSVASGIPPDLATTIDDYETRISNLESAP